MKEIKFSEKISDYKIIKQSEIIVFNNSEITIEIAIQDEDPLILRINFNDNKDIKHFNVVRNIEGKTMILTFENLKEPTSTLGFFEPMELAKSDCGDVLYFNCTITTFSNDEGNRLVKYSFLVKE